MKKFIFALFFTIMIISDVNAQSTLALQEKCAEGAKKFFLDRINLYGGRWGSFSDEKGRYWNNFESHYNKKLDKCFIRIDYSYHPKDWENEEAITSTEIFNVFEGTQIAMFNWGKKSKEEATVLCFYLGKCCTPRCDGDRWNFDNLIRPYMKE